MLKSPTFLPLFFDKFVSKTQKKETVTKRSLTQTQILFPNPKSNFKLPEEKLTTNVTILKKLLFFDLSNVLPFGCFALL